MKKAREIIVLEYIEERKKKERKKKKQKERKEVKIKCKYERRALSFCLPRPIRFLSSGQKVLFLFISDAAATRKKPPNRTNKNKFLIIYNSHKLILEFSKS